MERFEDLINYIKEYTEIFFEELISCNLTYREKLEVLLESGLVTGIGYYLQDCPPSLEDDIIDSASDGARGIYYFSDKILDEYEKYSEEECKELFDWFIKYKLIGCQIDW